MALADMAVGADGAIQRMLLQRLAAEHYADQMKQQAFQNERLLKGDARDQQQLDQQGELTRMQREQQAASAQATQMNAMRDDARASRETHMPGELVGAQSPTVQRWQQADVPIGQAVPGVAPRLYTSPTDTKGTPGAQPTGAAGYLLTPTSKQADGLAAQADHRADNARLDTAATETRRHNGVMEGAAARQAGASGENRDLANQLKALQIQIEQGKLDKSRTDQQTHIDNATQTTEQALKLAQALKTHPGFNQAYGAVSSRFADFSQDAIDAGAIREQLVAALTMPNLGALKGAMSNKDILFIKGLSTRLANPRISEGEARKAVTEAESFLNAKLGKSPAAADTAGAVEEWVRDPQTGRLVKKGGT